MRFLFIQPDFPRQYVTFFPVYEPIHGLIFAAIIKDLGETYLFDRRFGTDEDLVRVLQEFKPDIVGITTHTAGEIYSVKRMLLLVKRTRPQALAIVGGQHATLLPEDLFDTASVDLVCIGPGEETFREIAEAVAEGKGFDVFRNIPGLAVRDGEGYALTAPRVPASKTRISWPRFDRSLIRSGDRKHYFNHFERCKTVYTITSSGCPYRCSFCSLWAAARGTYRRRDPEEIVDDISSQPQPFVHICDDNTFHNESHAMEIARLLKARGIRKKILAYARTDTVAQKPHVIQAWREVGLGALITGMEAVSDRHLDYINKKNSVDVNVAAQKVLDEIGVENWAHFVILPQFEEKDFEDIRDFVEEYDICYPIFVPLTPVPGTPLFFEMKEKEKLTTYDYGFYTLQYMVTATEMPKEEWYERYLGLYERTLTAKTIWKRRKSATFHLKPMAGRTIVMRKWLKGFRKYIAEQLELERSVRYEDIEHTLPPSLRRDYEPCRYYNAPTLARMEEKLLTPAGAAVSCGDHGTP